MGVPALFRWLSQKYPKIVSRVIEEHPREVDGIEIPVDTRDPNPNGEEFDNLYLDMNGIVHPCSHPENGPAPKNEEEMMIAIFKYTDRVVNMVRPRKLLLIAIDGVAPRAKMNQQRSRRFRTAREAKEKAEDKAELLKLLKSQDSTYQESEETKAWDSNLITPGTPFMDVLAASLRYWIAYKLNTDLAWSKIKVIISDSSVPGEGEHKIMEFIRSQRSSPEYDPNTKHVMYGLDADLIMLGLGTHEPHFNVLREDVFALDSKPRVCHMCNQPGHESRECTGKLKIKDGDFDEKNSATPLKPFIWLHVSVLREYLAAELNVPEQPFRFDLERALDDWVFMCFFVGNDFLPHLPSLEIRENGIDTLIAIWRDNIPQMGGYLTKDGHVDFKKAQFILRGLAKQEDAIFRRRKQVEDRREANSKRRKIEHDRESRGAQIEGADLQDPLSNSRLNLGHNHNTPTGLPLFTPDNVTKEAKKASHDMVVNRGAIYKANLANRSAAALLKGKISGNEPTENSINTCIKEQIDVSENSNIKKRKASMLEDSDNTISEDNSIKPNIPQKRDDEPQPDTVRLWEEGYADRYYEQKFGADPKDYEFRHKVAKAYAEGLAWVLLYYFQGCPSWEWYYPYHYAPFAADFVDIGDLEVSFQKGNIFRPFEQLLGVLPAGSRQAIPEQFHHLMTNPDSEIIDFYPEDFTVDLNGKKWAWQGVALLPFIDSRRLLDAMAKVYPFLPSDVSARNGVGKDVLLFAESNRPFYEEVTKNFYSKKQGPRNIKLNPRLSQGLIGEIGKNDAYLPHSTLVFPLPSEEMPSLDDDRSISVHYEMPKPNFLHKSMLLRGTVVPPPKLTPGDAESTREKAGRTGRNYGGVPLSGDGRKRNQFNYGSSNQQNPRNKFYGQSGTRNNYSTKSFPTPTPGWQPLPPGMVGFACGPPPQSPGGYVNNGRGQAAFPPPPTFRQLNASAHGYYPQGNNYRGREYFRGHPSGPRR